MDIAKTFFFQGEWEEPQYVPIQLRFSRLRVVLRITDECSK
jgi:hypothetical protein